jgi:hypothetical protein
MGLNHQVFFQFFTLIPQPPIAQQYFPYLHNNWQGNKYCILGFRSLYSECTVAKTKLLNLKTKRGTTLLNGTVA